MRSRSEADPFTGTCRSPHQVHSQSCWVGVIFCFHGDGDVLYLRGSKTGADALAQLADQGDVYTAERTQARGARACVRSLTEGDGVAWKVERRRLTTEVEWRDLFF